MTRPEVVGKALKMFFASKVSAFSLFFNFPSSNDFTLLPSSFSFSSEVVTPFGDVVRMTGGGEELGKGRVGMGMVMEEGEGEELPPFLRGGSGEEEGCSCVLWWFSTTTPSSIPCGVRLRGWVDHLE